MGRTGSVTVAGCCCWDAVVCCEDVVGCGVAGSDVCLDSLVAGRDGGLVEDCGPHPLTRSSAKITSIWVVAGKLVAEDIDIKVLRQGYNCNHYRPLEAICT